MLVEELNYNKYSFQFINFLFLMLQKTQLGVNTQRDWINIFHHFKDIFLNALEKIALDNEVHLSDQLLSSFTIEPSKERQHGNLACNIAMTNYRFFAKIFQKHFNGEPSDHFEIDLENGLIKAL